MAGTPSAAISSIGLILAMKATAAATTYTTIAEVFDVTPPNPQDDEIEVTNFLSPDGAKEFIGGLTDYGEASFQINWVPGSATETMILDAKATRKARGFKITWPNGATWTYDLLIKGFEPSAPLGDKLTATITGRVSGSLVRGPAS